MTYRDTRKSSKRLELIRPSQEGKKDKISVKLQKFEIYTLSTRQVGGWNLCHLRPGVYHKRFSKHMCDKLTLDFGEKKDVELFKRSVLKLRRHALGLPPARASLPPPLPPVSRGSSSSGTGQLQVPSVMLDANSRTDNPAMDPYSSTPNPTINDDNSSSGYTIDDDDSEADYNAPTAESASQYGIGGRAPQPLPRRPRLPPRTPMQQLEEEDESVHYEEDD